MDIYSKAKNNLKNDMLVIFIIESLINIYSIYKGNTNYYGIGFALLLFAGYLLTRKGSKAAGIVGIVVGCLMMLTILNRELTAFLFGLLIVLHSSKYIKSFGE